MSNQGDGFARRTVELSAGRIHVREAGEGRPLLFVHGWGVNGDLWTDLAAELRDGFRCIVPDLPFGSHPEALRPEADLSPPGAAAIVAELIEALELDAVTVVGNDSGGAVSQILVTEHPARIERLVLTNCDCLEVFPPGRYKLLARLLALPGFMPLLAASLRLDPSRRSPLAYGPLSRRRLDGELLDSWVRPPIEDRGVRRDSRKFGRGGNPRYTLAAAEKLARLPIPVLLVWGADDPFFKPELARRLAELIPDSRLVEVPGAKTFIPIDAPERVAAEIRTFVPSESPVA